MFYARPCLLDSLNRAALTQLRCLQLSPSVPSPAKHRPYGDTYSLSRPLLVLSLLLAPASLVRGDTFGITLHLPSRIPKWAGPLSPHLASLSIEMDRWTDWAGAEIGQPNEYVNQLLRNLGERTGSMPFLRVGGESLILQYIANLTPCHLRCRRRSRTLSSFPFLPLIDDNKITDLDSGDGIQ